MEEAKPETENTIEEAVSEFPPDFIYTKDKIQKPLRFLEISKSCLQFYKSFGYNSQRLYNIHGLSEDTVIFIAGSNATILSTS